MTLLHSQTFVHRHAGNICLLLQEVSFHHFLCVSGGTIDITVHEVLHGGALKELHKASGNDLGGQTVDRKFKEFLREIFSHGV